jgi:hypothetical protein
VVPGVHPLHNAEFVFRPSPLGEWQPRSDYRLSCVTDKTPPNTLPNLDECHFPRNEVSVLEAARRGKPQTVILSMSRGSSNEPMGPEGPSPEPVMPC